MSRFKEIDSKLEKLSNKLNARLSKDRPDYPEALRTFEERRIDWESDDIRRSIIIQPTFEVTGVNSTIWNFIAIAWKEEGCLKRRCIKGLVEEKDFTEIAQNIDILLEESEKLLTRISDKDLI
ncbi:hypothetical protein Q0590_36690 [Rhodocytophaga aerolata]|uniref:Uncharacterized protein n=1 Tax=Rhodocytophaga aerolata TaxID=455078 RepID=A0ABT8RIF3_9BACT|nr:hypothetical protein [Rhodocytophaga aerolata]MDO1451865.1 hypothetical protein [Rhodocytophaga aerolata]